MSVVFFMSTQRGGKALAMPTGLRRRRVASCVPQPLGRDLHDSGLNSKQGAMTSRQVFVGDCSAVGSKQAFALLS